MIFLNSSMIRRQKDKCECESPRSKGGADDLDNLQLLCGACNSTKGNRMQEYLIQALVKRAGRSSRVRSLFGDL